MLKLRNKIITTSAPSGSTNPIMQLKTNSYINSGDMLDAKFITDKYNYYILDKKIDLRFTNTVSNEYVNIGDWVEAEQINHIINDMP